VNYKVLNQREPELAAFGFVPGSAGNFYSGDFDLFLTSKLGEKASVLAEVVIGEGDAQSFSVDLARALLKYDYNDHLRMSFGRYHTSIGFYNTAFTADGGYKPLPIAPSLWNLPTMVVSCLPKPLVFRIRAKSPPGNGERTTFLSTDPATPFAQIPTAVALSTRTTVTT
jgi:hypothetical protein